MPPLRETTITSNFGIPQVDNSDFKFDKIATWIPGITILPNYQYLILFHMGDIKRFLAQGGRPDQIVVHFLTFDSGVIDPLWEKKHFLNRVDRLRELGITKIISPDFSAWTDWPLATQIYNIYRSAVVTSDLLLSGFVVIANVTFGHPSLFDLHTNVWKNTSHTVLFDLNHTPAHASLTFVSFKQQYDKAIKIFPNSIGYSVTGCKKLLFQGPIIPARVEVLLHLSKKLKF